MRTRETALTWTDTSPAAASTAVSTALIKNSILYKAERIQIAATLTGGTGGTLDVYLQYKFGTNAWIDWCHFPQVAAATTKKYHVTITGLSTSIVNANGTDASPTVALAANSVVDVIPTGDIRVVFVAGASTSAGAAQTIVFTPITDRR